MKFSLPKPPANKVFTRKPAKKSGTQTQAKPVIQSAHQSAQVAHWVAQFRQAFGIEHNYQKALNCVLQAHALDPQNATVACDVATSYLYLENYPQAIDYAQPTQSWFWRACGGRWSVH